MHSNVNTQEDIFSMYRTVPALRHLEPTCLSTSKLTNVLKKFSVHCWRVYIIQRLTLLNARCQKIFGIVLVTGVQRFQPEVLHMGLWDFKQLSMAVKGVCLTRRVATKAFTMWTLSPALSWMHSSQSRIRLTQDYSYAFNLDINLHILRIYRLNVHH